MFCDRYDYMETSLNGLKAVVFMIDLNKRILKVSTLDSLSTDSKAMQSPRSFIAISKNYT